MSRPAAAERTCEGTETVERCVTGVHAQSLSLSLGELDVQIQIHRAAYLLALFFNNFSALQKLVLEVDDSALVDLGLWARLLPRLCECSVQSEDDDQHLVQDQPDLPDDQLAGLGSLASSLQALLLAWSFERASDQYELTLGSELCQLTGLTYLHLRDVGSDRVDFLPGAEAFGALAQLINLSTFFEEVCLPLPVVSLPALTRLNLARISWESQAPFLCSLRGLVYLDVSAADWAWGEVLDQNVLPELGCLEAALALVTYLSWDAPVPQWDGTLVAPALVGLEICGGVGLFHRLTWPTRCTLQDLSLDYNGPEPVSLHGLAQLTTLTGLAFYSRCETGPVLLTPPQPLPHGPCIAQLQSVILEGVGVTGSGVFSVLQRAVSLKELHLSNNPGLSVGQSCVDMVRKLPRLTLMDVCKTDHFLKSACAWDDTSLDNLSALRALCSAAPRDCAGCGGIFHFRLQGA